jgi:hypothetical protein
MIKEKIKKVWEILKTNHKIQIILVVSLTMVIALVIAAFLFWPEKQFKSTIDRYKININAFRNSNAALPLTMPRRLDGMIVATADANKLPVCVMIENAAFSGVRPQSGLSSASLVYEIIVEGGITRLMAVFAGEPADPVGPVRSARDTYLEFASELDCMYVHAGGSYTALLALQEMNLKDLDGLRESKYFWRDPNKSSPHNFFTKTDNLYEAVTIGHSWTTAPNYDSWKFKAATKSINITTSEINIYFGGAYDVQYKYNQEKNYYERYNGGTEHTDNNTGNILTTNNIVIQTVPLGEYIEGKGRINFDVTGEGKAYIFNEGKVTEGVWKKADRLARTKYYDANGKEVEFIRGNTWIEIVPEDRGFDFK